MRTEQFLRASTKGVRLALARFDSEYVSRSSRDAVTMFIYRFLKRNKLTLRRITH